MKRLRLVGSALCLLGALLVVAQYFFDLNQHAQDFSRQAFGTSSTVTLGSDIRAVIIYLTGFFIALSGAAVIASIKEK